PQRWLGPCWYSSLASSADDRNATTSRTASRDTPCNWPMSRTQGVHSVWEECRERRGPECRPQACLTLLTAPPARAYGCRSAQRGTESPGAKEQPLSTEVCLSLASLPFTSSGG